MLNSVTLIGNLGKDPELTYTGSGKAIAKFSIATSSGKDKTDWHNIVVWEKQAESCGKYLVKGSTICIQGRITQQTWDNKEGVKQYKTEIIAGVVKFLPGKKKEEGSQELPKNGEAANDDIPF